METTFYEDDFLSSIVFNEKKDDFYANQSFFTDPNLLKVSELDGSAPLSLSPLREELCKVVREGGNPEEDEGFEDFIEDENSEALQKDCDPTLAGSSSFNEDCKSEQLDLFSILDSEATDDMLVSTKPPFMSLPFNPAEEIIDFDQGVAMEGDHHHPNQNSIFTDDIPFDLPLSSSPCTLATTSMNTDPPLTTPTRFLSPTPPSSSASPQHHLSFMYPQPSTILTPSPQPPPTPPTTCRQNSELDLICSVIQSEAQQPSNTFTNDDTTHCSSNKIYLDSNGIELINLLNSSATVQPMGDVFSPYPLSAGSEPTSNGMLPAHHAGSMNQSPLTVADVANLGAFSTSNFSESPQYTTNGQRTPPPSPFVPPSPVSSVTTECSESDYGKDKRRHSNRSNNDDTPTNQIVSMPFYEFKKILESSSVSERDKEQAKVIRKRGKNKVAAKHCRQRKVEIIMGLEQEIEKLKGFKASLAMKVLRLQKTIEEDKRKIGLVSNNTLQANNRLII